MSVILLRNFLRRLFLQINVQPWRVICLFLGGWDRFYHWAVRFQISALPLGKMEILSRHSFISPAKKGKNNQLMCVFHTDSLKWYFYDVNQKCPTVSQHYSASTPFSRPSDVLSWLLSYILYINPVSGHICMWLADFALQISFVFQ